MANIVVNSLANCGVYLDGVGYVGRAEEVSVPHPKAKLVDHKGLGMWFDAELPVGADKMESKFKWASFDQAALQAAASPFLSHNFQILGNLETYTSLGRTTQAPVIYMMTGVFKDGGEAGFKKHEMVDIPSVVTVYHSELYVSGVQIFMCDVFSNQYVVGGVDQLASFRANIGG